VQVLLEHVHVNRILSGFCHYCECSVIVRNTASVERAMCTVCSTREFAQIIKNSELVSISLYPKHCSSFAEDLKVQKLVFSHSSNHARNDKQWTIN